MGDPHSALRCRPCLHACCVPLPCSLASSSQRLRHSTCLRSLALAGRHEAVCG